MSAVRLVLVLSMCVLVNLGHDSAGMREQLVVFPPGRRMRIDSSSLVKVRERRNAGLVNTEGEQVAVFPPGRRVERNRRSVDLVNEPDNEWKLAATSSRNRVENDSPKSRKRRSVGLVHEEQRRLYLMGPSGKRTYTDPLFPW